MERSPEKESRAVSRGWPGYSLNFHSDSFSPPFLVSARLKRFSVPIKLFARWQKKGRGAACRGRRSLAHRAGNKAAPARIIVKRLLENSPARGTPNERKTEEYRAKSGY